MYMLQIGIFINGSNSGASRRDFYLWRAVEELCRSQPAPLRDVRGAVTTARPHAQLYSARVLLRVGHL